MKIHSKKSKIVLILVLSLVAVLLVAFLFSVSFGFLPTDRKNYISLYGSTDPIEFKSVLDELRIIYMDYPGYWEDWNWEEHMFMANVVRNNEDDRSLHNIIGVIFNPRNAKFSGEARLIHLSCSGENTIEVAKSLENPADRFKGGDFDINLRAKENDILFAYCLDEDCLNAGNLCILMSD